MLFTTPTQWLALAVALIAGWLFGLASHPGGRKWKQRYADERDVHGRTRNELDARIAERDARIQEFERENARLAKATPVMAATHSPIAQAQTQSMRPQSIGQSGMRPAGTMRARWFDWNNRVGTNG